MRIAVFHQFLDNIGGAEVVTLTLAKELAADVYTTNIDGDRIRKMGFGEILPRIYSIGKIPINPPFRQCAAFLRFRLLNLKGKYNFFIIAGDWAISGAVNNKPNLAYIHSALGEIWFSQEELKNYLSPWKIPFYKLWAYCIRFFYRRYFRHLKKRVCNSENIQNKIRKYFNQMTTVVYPPVYTLKYRQKKSKNFWLSVNRLIFHKRIALQLKAFSKIPYEKLVVVGSYEKGVRNFEKYKSHLESICPKNVNILHWVSEKELLNLYAECKGVIATAIDEDFGMSLVEAMASGKPVIAAFEGGYKETVVNGVTGVLIKNINENKLVEAIKLIGQNPEKYREACLRQAQKFDTKIFIEKINKEIKTFTKKI